MRWGSYLQVLQNITSQSPLKNVPFWTITPPSSLFLLFCKCAKYAQRHTKNVKQRSDIKKSCKSCQTFAENYFMNLIFPKIGTIVFPQVKTQFLLRQKNFLVIENMRKFPNYEKLEYHKMTHPSRHVLAICVQYFC